VSAMRPVQQEGPGYSGRLLICFGFAAGWLLALLTIVLRRQVADAAATGAWFIATLFLARQSDFPNRRGGLLASPIGPVTWSAWSLVYEVYLSQMVHFSAGAQGALVLFAGRAIVGTLLMLWLWRGYGLIPFLAVMATFFPWVRNVREAAGQYPWRFWWLLLAVPIVLEGVRATALCFFIARLP